MNDIELKPKIEALLVGAGKWVKIADLARVLGLTIDEAKAALMEFEAELMALDRGIQLHRRGTGVRIEVKAPYVELMGELFPERRPKPFTDQADEVLAVIAHRPGISVKGVGDIRGVDSAGVMATLAERGLIQRLQRRGENRERLWKVSQLFLDMHNLTRAEDIFKEEVAARVFPGLVAPGTEG